MRTAVQEINQEYEARLDAIKSSTRHDVLEMSCSRVEWCACFVSWCANECGYIDAGVIPKFAGCGTGVQWFKDRGLWQDRNYEPRPGDIIFFDWNDENGQDGDSDHVGIVEKVEDGVVYTVEGNSGDMCQENRYTEGYYEILGYGTPAY
ncbi:MAG: CHAP domain-containing protein [Acutalibacter sp.]|nr:CHAP domain-containing protein [Acutalibacter sp.]